MEIIKKIFFLSAIFILLILPFSGNIMYSTPDDNMYLLITSGAYTGSPSPYTIFEGFIYSSIISNLYSILKGVEWYSVVHYGLSIFAYSIITFNIYKSKCSFLIKFAITFFTFVLQAYFLISPQNTLLSSELALVSLILISTKEELAWKCFAILLFVIGVDIRYDAAMLVYMIGWPITIFTAKSKNLIGSKKNIIFVISLLFFAFVLKKNTQSVYESNHEWQYYKEYNIERGKINDNPNNKKALEILSDNNKRIEYELLCEYRVNDGTILNAKELKECANYIKESQSSILYENYNAYIKCYKDIGGIFCLFLIILCIIESVRMRDKRQMVIMLISFFMFALANIKMMLTTVPKERVIIPALLTITISTLLVTNIKRYKFPVIVCISLLSFQYLLKVKDVYHSNKVLLAQTESVESLINNCPYKKVLIHNMVPISTEAFHSSSSHIGKKMVRCGWLINSPLNKENYVNLKSVVNTLPIMVNRQYTKYLTMQEQLIRDYYNIDTYRDTLSMSDNYIILQINSK